MDYTVGKKGGKAIFGTFSNDLAQEFQRGLVFKADTIEELATKCGMVPAILRATIDTWNEDVARGVDRLFGRTIGTDIRQPETNGIMQAIVEPPFYAVPMHLVSPETTITTLGGVKINGRAQVINTSGGVIPRLYAAGSTTGGFIGPFYQQSGGGICQAYTMGRIAGKNAAAETPLP